ncbi:MAG: hypothetical protein LQ351_004406 [Letrouitia transgressa]|nr:MAG: hypothetical protein LQ351_004406 [Letrouitia transgressa]
MVYTVVRYVVGLLMATAVFAQQAGKSNECGGGKKCPASKPCCSQYGQCGVGAFCLGGCDPRNSNKIESCVPAPVCRSQDYKLISLDGITPNTEYLGDSSKSNWVSSGTPKVYNNQVLLTLSETGASGSGTLLASTSYVWYGKISAQLKTSRGQGVVTAFILMSDVQDEIDFEFVGTELEQAQSNYYFQGIPNYEHGQNITVKSSTYDDYHTYELDWQPDQLTWTVDGDTQNQRTLKKSETYNSTTKRYEYPQTPSRVQFSLWPAGSKRNGEGTIAWAGGLVNWNSPDVQSSGYYYAMVKDVNVKCYDPPDDAQVKGKNAYIYTSSVGTENKVAVTDDDTVLKSLLGTGTDMDKDYPHASASGTAEEPEATSDVATVPGLTGAGPGTNGHPGNNGNDGTTGGTGTDSGSGTAASGASGSSSTGFSQGGPATTPENGAPSQRERGAGSSMFAALMALAGWLIL